jgi:hypothetical protein
VIQIPGVSFFNYQVETQSCSTLVSDVNEFGVMHFVCMQKSGIFGLQVNIQGVCFYSIECQDISSVIYQVKSGRAGGWEGPKKSFITDAQAFSVIGAGCSYIQPVIATGIPEVKEQAGFGVHRDFWAQAQEMGIIPALRPSGKEAATGARSGDHCPSAIQQVQEV